MTSLHSIAPSALGAASGPDWFSLSGAMSANGIAFANILQDLSATGNATQSGSPNDPLAQLTALIENGTPLSKIVDQISQNVGNALQTQLAGLLPQSQIDGLKSSITQSIANALSPPGNAPPGTPQQQAASLAARLRRLIETLARNANQDLGQQNELAGTLLDAKSAKDIPAQASGKQATSTLDVSSLVSSLLSQALAQTAGQLRELKANPLQAAAPWQGRVLRADPLHRDSTPVVPSLLAQQSPPPSLAPAADDPLPGTSSGQSPNLVPSQSAVTMQNAPDVLARMLVRAAGTDARINGTSALIAGGTPSSNDGTPSASTLASRLDALLASIATNASNAGASSNASFTGGGTGDSSAQQFAQTAQGAATHANDASPSSNALGLPAFSSTTALQSALQTATTVAPHVDTTAIIEQMIKGMNMRTNAQGTSEIRLHLQPENLGDMTMKITVTGSQISANVVASSADVRNALISNHHQLAKTLADAGLTLSGFSVDVSGGNAGRDRQNNDRTSGFGRRFTVHELPANQSDTPAVAALGPPLLSGSSLALFNYLA